MRKRSLRLFRWLVQLLFWPLRLSWRGLGRLGIWLRRGLEALIRAVWRGLFLLASGLRRLLLAPLWRLLGRMGRALHNLFRLLFWRPFLFMSAPWRLLYRRTLHRPLTWLFARLLRPFRWLVVRPLRALRRRLRARWRAGRPARLRLKRRIRSPLALLRARAYVFLQNPRPPRGTITLPAVPVTEQHPVRTRVKRFATSAVAVGLVIAASLITAQQAPRLRGAGAQSNYQLSSSKFVEETTFTAEAPTATPQASPTPWPTPDPLNSGGSVAFTLRQNGNSNIYVLSIGQSQPVRLTNHPAEDRDPAWSPDGRRLAFASRRGGNWDIYVLDLQDGSLRRITDDTAFDAGPSWSPDGQWLVFESYRQNNLDLYIVSADGKQGPIRLTLHPAPDFSPMWSPGGRHVVFTSWRNGNKDIFMMALDEAAEDVAYNVTQSPGRQEDDPAFSPDGAFLAYSEDSTGFDLIYTLPLDNYTPAGDASNHGQGRHPTWSPDGQALTFVYSAEAGQTHLIASSLDAWSVAPQAFTAQGRLDDAAWSARTLPLRLSDHLQEINQTTDETFFVETVNPPQEEGPPYLLQELPINAPSPYLSDRVDQSFLALRERVIEEAGWDFLGETDNMYEPLDVKPAPGQTDRTWNKAGRAFDYVSRYVLDFEPRVEVVREDEGYETYWRTYLLAAAQDGTQGEPLRDLPWDFRARYGAESRYYDQGGKLKDDIPAGYYVDFTALAADYGWAPVPAADNWRTFFPGIFFWHYEKRQELNWELAMLELYTPEQLLSAFR